MTIGSKSLMQDANIALSDDFPNVEDNDVDDDDAVILPEADLELDAEGKNRVLCRKRQFLVNLSYDCYQSSILHSAYNTMLLLSLVRLPTFAETSDRTLDSSFEAL